MKLLILLTAIVMIAGCGQSTIDASTDETMKASIEKIKQGMTPAQAEEFEEATGIVAMEDLDLSKVMEAAFRGEEVDVGDFSATARAKLDGKTADQIIAEADRIREERRRREIAQVTSEIAETEAKLAEMLEHKRQAEEIKSELSKIVITNTRLYWRDPSEFSFGEDLVLELTAKNNLDTAISRLFMTGTLATPGRSVPWLTKDFNYQIAGGLEPGEEQSWRLAPNRFSGGWSKTPRDRDDTVFTVTIRNAEGPDGDELFDVDYDEREFERTARRLETLRESLSKLEEPKSQ